MRNRRLSLAAPGLLLALALAAPGTAQRRPPGPIEIQHADLAVAHESDVEGFLTPLNGKFKLRASEAQFSPGGVVRDHLHPGPGIRYVLAGELHFIDSDTGEEARVPTGGYFYEGGDKSFRVENRAQQPARMLVVELLPAEWKGSAAVPLAYRSELEKIGKELEARLCPRR